MDAANRDAKDSLLPLRIALARATQVLGWQGWVGLALIAAAVSLLSISWVRHQELIAALASPPPEVRSVTIDAAPTAPATSTLPLRTDIPLLLTQIQQIAVARGLAWNAADYKLIAATDSAPAALEVRCTLKAPYPQLRGTLAQWLRDVPGLAIRDLSLSRLNSDTADVEGKLVIAVFLQNITAVSTPTGAGKP